MKQKIMLSLIATIVLTAVSCLCAKTLSNSGEEYSDLTMQNIEALTDNESEGESKCEGWLGSCHFKCKHCGYEFSAIGSTFKNNHKCSQK